MIDLLVIILYTLALLVIFIYSLSQLHLLLNYFKALKSTDTAEKFNFEANDEYPFVTIQLPLYNEEYVVERLLNNIARIEYPREKLEIQVLDDSTDDSVNITSKLIKSLSQQGLDIQHICRQTRTGYKAGALKEGLKIARGEYIAVFDSDFVPGRNWLKQTLPKISPGLFQYKMKIKRKSLYPG